MTARRTACLVAVALVLFATPLGAQTTASATVRAGIVWWPADSAEAMGARSSDLEDCLAARISEVAPEIVMTRQQGIREALFPLLQPATQPATDEAFAALLAREDVRARLAQRGLRYLIAFAAKNRKEVGRGSILCIGGPGAAGCLGLAWVGESTAIDAAIWSLDDGAGMQREGARAEGTSVLPAFVLPVPIPARTQADACRELGARIALAIRRTDAAESARKR